MENEEEEEEEELMMRKKKKKRANVMEPACSTYLSAWTIKAGNRRHLMHDSRG